jgi:hypothetical protein
MQPPHKHVHRVHSIKRKKKEKERKFNKDYQKLAVPMINVNE